MRRRALALFTIGILAMVGDLSGAEALFGLGMATHASPAPKVFTARDGVEGFSSVYTLSWNEAGHVRSLELTPEVYGRLEGPYNRRNVYGAAMAGGSFLEGHPVLGDLHARVITHAFCERDMLAELGHTGPTPDRLWLDVRPRGHSKADPALRMEVHCIASS